MTFSEVLSLGLSVVVTIISLYVRNEIQKLEIRMIRRDAEMREWCRRNFVSIGRGWQEREDRGYRMEGEG